MENKPLGKPHGLKKTIKTPLKDGTTKIEERIGYLYNYDEVVSAREGLKCQLFYYFDHEHAGEDIKYNDILEAIDKWLGGDE